MEKPDKTDEVFLNHNQTHTTAMLANRSREGGWKGGDGSAVPSDDVQACQITQSITR